MSAAVRGDDFTAARTHVIPIMTTWRDVKAARQVGETRAAEVAYWRDMADRLRAQVANLERAGAMVAEERDRLAIENAHLRRARELWVGDLGEIDRALAALSRRGGGG